MLGLDDAAWRSLPSAYPGEDIPARLRELASFPPGDDYQAEPYFTLWSALCHQGDVYPASYAAVPHIVEAIRASPERAHWSALLLVVCIELSRIGIAGKGPPVPESLSDTYRSALALLPEIVERLARRRLDDSEVRAATAALALANGEAALANAIVKLGPSELEAFPDWIANL
jgi:hypothetical protein